MTKTIDEIIDAALAEVRKAEEEEAKGNLLAEQAMIHRASANDHWEEAEQIAQDLDGRVPKAWIRSISLDGLDPRTMPCDDCGRTDGTHDPEVEH